MNVFLIKLFDGSEFFTETNLKENNQELWDLFHRLTSDPISYVILWYKDIIYKNPKREYLQKELF